MIAVRATSVDPMTESPSAAVGDAFDVLGLQLKPGVGEEA